MLFLGAPKLSQIGLSPSQRDRLGEMLHKDYDTFWNSGKSTRGAKTNFKTRILQLVYGVDASSPSMSVFNKCKCSTTLSSLQPTTLNMPSLILIHLLFNIYLLQIFIWSLKSFFTMKVTSRLGKRGKGAEPLVELKEN